MDDLIKALQILRKYGGPKYPTHCEHDVLLVLINPAIVSSADVIKLNSLGFIACGEDGEEYQDCFMSFRFGSS